MIDELIAFLKSKKYKMAFIAIIIVIGFVSITILGQDNVIEQSIEYFVKIFTGADLDISPF